MKIALCTTTIHVPHALKLMRKCSDDIGIFVALDQKTPNLMELAKETRAQLLFGDRGEWKCSQTIGWNTLARRNIAFLEALKWGADVIYSWDNDNLPVDVDHFGKIEDIFVEPFSGLKGSHVRHSFFDAGALIYPWSRHRGIPFANAKLGHRYDIATDAKVGVAAGLILGDPDIDAVTRMELRPDNQIISEAGRAGIVVDPNTWTVFNSQNTAVIRELIPAWFMMPGVGRHDDIYASLIVQRVARERDYHVHFGKPFTYQQRNEHNLITDLRKEIDGMENVEKLALLLDSIILPGKSVIGDVKTIYMTLEHADWIPDNAIYAAYKWLEDCEAVL